MTSIELPSQKYPVIYADPPWNFDDGRNWNNNQKHVTEHYNVMGLADIAALPVKDIAADDAVLFMWTTAPMLQQSFAVLEAWGFVYKTMAFTWAKQNKSGEGFFTGMGYYTRSNPEFCLLGTRGKILKRKSKGVRQLLVAPRREHSRKPDETYDRIESLFDGPYLEMFSRSSRAGWTLWGNEVGKFD